MGEVVWDGLMKGGLLKEEGNELAGRVEVVGMEREKKVV